MSYASIQAKADAMFTQDRIDLFMSEIEKRIDERPVKPANEQELKLAIQSEYHAIKQSWVNETIRTTLVEKFMEILDYHNTTDKDMTSNTFFEALMRNHRTIQSEFWLHMIEVFAKVSNAPSHLFDERNDWTKNLCRNLYNASMYPDRMETITHPLPRELGMYDLNSRFNEWCKATGKDSFQDWIEYEIRSHGITITNVPNPN